MALAHLLKPDTFKRATLNIGFKDRGLAWQPAPLKKCASLLRKLAEQAPSGADGTDKQLMTAVDHVMLRFFPRHERWDDPELELFLLEKADLLDQIASDKPVDMASLESVFKFCEEMWIVLSALETKRSIRK